MWWPGIALVASLRAALAAGLLLFGYPLLLLPRRPEWSRSDRAAASGMLGLAVLLAAGHVLGAVGLFEPLGLFMFLIAAVLVSIRLIQGPGALRRLAERSGVAMLTFADRLLHGRRQPARAREEAAAAAMPAAFSWTLLPVWLLAFAVAGVTLYARLSSAWNHAAPPFSDYPELLQWTNWLTMGKPLFPDWVYPKGMNVLFAAFALVTQERSHLLMLVGGPLASLLTAGSIWYAVRSATASRVAGLVAAAVYAGAPLWLPAEWTRQAGTLPQELSMMLLLPAAWWAFRYMDRGDSLDILLVGCAAYAAAATHWGALGFLAVMLIATAAIAIWRKGAFVRALRLGLWTGLAVLLGLLPQGLALASGVPLLRTAVEFAGGDAAGFFRPLPAGLAIGLGGAAILAAAGVWQRRERLLIPALLGALTLVYYLPALGIQSTALAVRSGEYLVLGAIAAFGAAYGGLEHLLTRGRESLGAGLAGLACAAGLWWLSPPHVLEPELQLTDELTQQVLTISGLMPRGQWLVVGRAELLALVQTRGQQQDGTAFAAAVPVPPEGVSAANSLASSTLSAPDTPPESTPALFFVVETTPYVSPVARNVGKAPEIEANNSAAARWVEAYSRTHDPPEVWYHSPALTIYRITPPVLTPAR